MSYSGSIPHVDAETYARESAAVDRAESTMRRLWPGHARGGAIPAEVTAHPDYLAVDNAMRGRVEQYELLHNTPDEFVAYVGGKVNDFHYNTHELTTWTGDRIGTVRLGSGWRVNSYMGTRMYQAHATVNNRQFTGRTFGAGMAVVLRETAASKRKRGADIAY